MPRTVLSAIVSFVLAFEVLSDPTLVGAALAVALTRRHIAGTYSDVRLAGIKSLTLPRVFLYDSSGALIAQDHWPGELQPFRGHAGDAFCCVSDKPAPPGSSGPPPDCKIVVYGTDVRANFDGLLNPSGKAVLYDSLPKHKYLLVEYFAHWCQPCVAGRKALATFFRTSKRAEDFLWVTIDLTRLPEVQEAARRGSALQPRPAQREAGCESSPVSLRLKAVAPAVGAEPIWMTGGGCWCGERLLKTAWIVDRSHRGTLEVRGAGLDVGVPVHFPSGRDHLDESFVVKDAHETGVTPGGIEPDEQARYAFHMGYVSYPQPGCYRLVATLGGRVVEIVVNQPRCPDCTR